MARENRHNVLRYMGVSEGGLVDHPDDPGGRTNLGVTQRVYNAWLRNQNREPRPVDYVTRDEADAIFFEQYMQPVWFDRLPGGLDYTVADYAVNSGPGQAVKDLQRSLHELGYDAGRVDGGMGNITFAAVTEVVADDRLEELIVEINERRIAFMKVIKNKKTGKRLWLTFGRGWQRRVMGETDGSQPGRDSGVIDRSVQMARRAGLAEGVAGPISMPKLAEGKAEGVTELPPVGILAAFAAFFTALKARR